jgi:hypothetical protein
VPTGHPESNSHGRHFSATASIAGVLAASDVAIGCGHVRTRRSDYSGTAWTLSLPVLGAFVAF